MTGPHDQVHAAPEGLVLAEELTNWYCRNPFDPYTLFQSVTLSSGWKNEVMFWISPTLCLGALRNHSSLNAFTVAQLIIRLGNTSGTVPYEARRTSAARCAA